MSQEGRPRRKAAMNAMGKMKDYDREEEEDMETCMIVEDDQRRRSTRKHFKKKAKRTAKDDDRDEAFLPEDEEEEDGERKKSTRRKVSKRRESAAGEDELTTGAISEADALASTGLPAQVNTNLFPAIQEQTLVIRRVSSEFVNLSTEEVVESLSTGAAADPSEYAFIKGALMDMITAGPHVDSARVQAAVNTINTANTITHKQAGGRLHPHHQQHGGDISSPHHKTGSFPVTTVMAEGVPGRDKTLGCTTNATVLVMKMLYGGMPRDLAVCSNLMPTTVAGGYTAVPKPTDYSLFEADYVEFFRELLKAGVRFHTAIAPSTAAIIKEKVAGGNAARVYVLRECNGFQLLLIKPPTLPSFLLEEPYEHRSHMSWQALRPETRMVLAAGAATTAAPIRALLGAAPLDADDLIKLVNLSVPVLEDGKVRIKGWYTSGAYCEAIMKTVRRYQFAAAYGQEEGEKQWQEWYTECKRRGGANQANEQSRIVMEGRQAGLQFVDVTHSDGTVKRVSTTKGTNADGGAAEREGHMEVNDKYDSVSVIREADGKEVVCQGISKVANQGGSTLLSLQGQDFAAKFDVEGKGTSLGQLIARGKVKAIVKLVKGGRVEYWELSEEDFERVYKPENKRGKYKLELAKDGQGWRRVDQARWLMKMQG